MKIQCTRCKKEMKADQMQQVSGFADLPTGEIFTFFGPLCPDCLKKFKKDFVEKKGRRDRWWEDWET